MSLPFNNFVITNKPSAGSPLHSFPPYLSGDYTTLRTPKDLLEELRKAIGADFAEQVLNGQRGVVATCGSGMTAAVLWLGLSRICETQQRQAPRLALYDEVSPVFLISWAHSSFIFSLGLDTLGEKKVRL